MQKTLPILLWLIIWQLVAVIVHNHILLAGPVETLQTLFSILQTNDFWISVRGSTGRILLGFAIGSALGIITAFFAYEYSVVRAMAKPFVTALKAVPVASFVILLLIWFGSRNISIYICAIVVFPILYLNTLEGLCSTDVKLLEMSRVFRMPKDRQIRYIMIPQLLPFLRSALKLSVGMGFKSGIAAEVISQATKTMGNGLYQAKIFLETGELFAWTLTIVIISFVCEKIIDLLLGLTVKGKRSDNRS